MKPFVVRAPGKLILLGEYAVLCGGDALVVAVDRHARCEVEPASNCHVSGRGMGDCALEWFDGACRGRGDDARLAFSRAVLEDHGDPPPGRYVLDSTELAETTAEARSLKLGLGGSAAATVALVAALYRGTAGPAEIFRAAHRAHRRVQGDGSGADIAAAAFGGTLHYTWHDAGLAPADGVVAAADGAARIVPLLRARDMVHVVWTGRAASTVELVRAVRAAWACADRRALAAREAIVHAAQVGIKAWSNGDSLALIDAARETTAALETLGEAAGVEIVLAAHRELDAEARRRGGAVKPTGAGGGDLAWIIGPDADATAAIAAHLEASGARVLSLGVARRGVS